MTIDVYSIQALDYDVCDLFGKEKDFGDWDLRHSDLSPTSRGVIDWNIAIQSLGAWSALS